MALNDGDGVTPLTLRWRTLKEAADEAGRSRLYGGIHFQDGDLRARPVGEQIGQRALKRAQEYWNLTR